MIGGILSGIKNVATGIHISAKSFIEIAMAMFTTIVMVGGTMIGGTSITGATSVIDTII